MSDYGIQFADWCELPPEAMVGETVFDGEGNAIGWIVNATAGRSCASCPEMDNPDSYISHLQSALKWHDEHVPRPTNPRNTCVVLEGENQPEEVMFVREDGGVTHYMPERTCKVVIEKRRNPHPWIHHYSCGYDFCQWPDCPIPVQRHCPNCGGRIEVSE